MRSALAARAGCTLAFCFVVSVARAQAPDLYDDSESAAAYDGVAETGSSIERSDQDVDSAFALEFGRDAVAYDRRVRSLRSTGWILVSAGVSWYPFLFTAFATLGDRDFDRELGIVAYSAVAPASLLLVGGACLIRARVMTGRKRRFLRRRSQGVEVSLAPLGAGLQLNLLW